MAILKFNKAELVNLSYSLKREIILANRTGAYCNTSIVSCNTRRYHGLLAVPVDNFGGDKHLLLSAVDESLVLNGHQFNLGIHCYDTMYEPRGHKYIVDFNADVVPEITYKVGSLLFSKSFLLSQDADQILVKYTLREAPSKVTLLLKPFLAFRNIHALTQENSGADTSFREIEGGAAFRMYAGFPDLNLQLSSSASQYRHMPYWYKGVTYSDEYRRGFDCKEDLFVPGTFSVEMRAGDSIVLSASVAQSDPRQLKRKFNNTVRKLDEQVTYKDILLRNAGLLKCNRGGKDQIIAGFSWMETGLLRETMISLPGLTLYADGNRAEFEAILDNLIADEHERFHNRTTQVEAPLRVADVLQQYIAFGAEPAKVWDKYGKIVKEVVESYLPGVRKEISLMPNGLLWAQKDNVALSWMNAYINGVPVTERAGYQVDTNAWWFNLVCFAVDMEEKWGDDRAFITRWTQVKELALKNFQRMFWNPEWGYLSDYVNNEGQHPEVRPNQMIAVYVKNSPIDDEVKASVMATVTNELMTRRGLRTLSPRNSMYRGVYEGSQIDRDLAYHQGCTRTELMGPYFDICFRMEGAYFLKKAERLVSGFYEDISKHGVGAFSELYDGDPPHEPHGAISSACATSALLWCEYLMDKYREESK